MILIKALLAPLLLAVYSLAEEIGPFGYPEEDGVITLDDSNLEEALQKFPYIFVKFYAPWCGVSKSKFQNYTEVARIMREEIDTPVPCARIDAEANPIAHKTHKIGHYPTFKFFINGESKFTNDLFRVKQTVEYLQQRLGPIS